MKSTGKYFLLTVIPLGMLIALMYYYAVDVFMWDEWEIVPLVDKYYKGTLTLSDLFAQHNEHRIFFGKLLIVANAVLTGWNVYYELAVNVLFAIGTSIIIFYAAEHSSIMDSLRKMMLYFVCACLIFSFSQSYNWLSGFQMQMFMAVFFAFLSIALITYGSGKMIFVSLIPAVMASYSFAGGLFVWPACFVILLLKRKTKGEILLWLFTAVLCMMLYFHNYENLQPSFIEKLKYLFIERPFIIIISCLCFLGASLAVGNHIAAISFGFIMFCVQAYCFVKIIRSKIRDNNILFWLGIDIFVILSALATGYGRPGIGGSMQHRYITICALFPIATMGIASLTLNVPRKVYMLAGLSVMALSFGDPALVIARQEHSLKEIFRQQMRNGEYDKEFLVEKIYPFRGMALERLAMMKKYGMKNYENAPDVTLDDIDDFRPVTFRPEKQITSCEMHITKDKTALKVTDYDGSSYYSLMDAEDSITL